MSSSFKLSWTKQGKQTHGNSSSRAGIICKYATQVITTFTTWLIVMSRKRGYTPRCTHYHNNTSEKALCSLGLHRLPDHSQAHDCYSKRRQHVPMCRNKEEGARGHNLLTVKYSYACLLFVCFSLI